jgi:prephenate dehydrogenase
MRSRQSLPHACAIALVLACNVHELGTDDVLRVIAGSLRVELTA